MEADHLGGDVDMVSVVTTLLEEQARRHDTGDPRWRIPFRPDHGHELMGDIGKSAFPGYSAIGRLKGLAEIRGVMTAVGITLFVIGDNPGKYETSTTVALTPNGLRLSGAF